MTINKSIIKKLQIIYQKVFSMELVDYLMDKYREESFPYEYSEQDSFNNVKSDIDCYYAGKLDITVLSPYEKLKKERDIYLSACITSELEIGRLHDRIKALAKNTLPQFCYQPILTFIVEQKPGNFIELFDFVFGYVVITSFYKKQDT